MAVGVNKPRCGWREGNLNWNVTHDDSHLRLIRQSLFICVCLFVSSGVPLP